MRWQLWLGKRVKYWACRMPAVHSAALPGAPLCFRFLEDKWVDDYKLQDLLRNGEVPVCNAVVEDHRKWAAIEEGWRVE
jgi:hypothetical protein